LPLAFFAEHLLKARFVVPKSVDWTMKALVLRALVLRAVTFGKKCHREI
jgi:hypothetical protein